VSAVAPGGKRAIMGTALTKAQLEDLRRKLEAERARILEVLSAAAPEASSRDQESELEESAQRQDELTRRLEIEARERALLVDVERALGKFEQGSYGVSEDTGEPIPYPRLAAVPWARGGVEE
jgi:RNA polymerase-binding transcription factor